MLNNFTRYRTNPRAFLFLIFGIPYLKQYDAGVTDPADIIMKYPDYTSYDAKPEDSRIFDPQKALTPLNENFNWEVLKESPGTKKPENKQEWMKENDKKQRNGNK